MRPLRDISIRSKLTLLVLLTSAVAILLGGAISIGYEMMRSHHELLSNLSAEAEIIGANSAAALAFRDQKAAREILSALRFRPEIVYGCLYDNDGNLFAEYHSPGTSPVRRTPHVPAGADHWFEAGDLLLRRTLRLGEDEVGSIYLRADLRTLRALLAAHAGISLVVVCVLVGLSWLISVRLQRNISNPILDLANLTRRIGTDRDYSRRATKRSADEIGVLTDGLNHMLNQIAEHETKLRRAYQSLQFSEERFRQLAENINEVFWLTNREKSEMIYVSPGYEKIWGRTCASLYHSPQDWMSAIHPDDRARVREAALAKQISGEYDEEYRILLPDGSIRWIRDRAFPISDDNHEVYRIAGIAADITERKRLEQELLEISEREKRRIGQDLHDGLGQQLVGTQLAVTTLANKLREQGSPETARAAEIGELLDEALTQARNLTRGLYPVGLATSGLAFALWHLASNIHRSFHVDCQVDCPEDVPIKDITVATHLYRITQESINNALKHGRATQIHIRLQAGPVCCTLTVEDNGSGMETTNHEPGGMGIQIMMYRARMIGGRLQILPRAQGGMIVRCTLPLPSIE